MEPLPWIFAVFQYFRDILSLIESLRCALWVGALLGACDVIEDGGHVGLGFYQKLKIIKKRRKLEIVNASHVKYEIIKPLLLFLCNFCFFHLKKAKNTQFYPKKGLDHLLLMTSYPVIATDSHQTRVKMCLRDMPTATEHGRC